MNICHKFKITLQINKNKAEWLTSSNAWLSLLNKEMSKHWRVLQTPMKALPFTHQQDERELKRTSSQ